MPAACRALIGCASLAAACLASAPLSADTGSDPSPDPCADQVDQARREGAGRLTPMLRSCNEEVEALKARQQSCAEVAPDPERERIVAAIRRLEAARTGEDPPTQGFDPLAALTAIEALLEAHGPAADTAPPTPDQPPADAQALAAAERRVVELERRVAELNAELERRGPAAPEPIAPAAATPTVSLEQLRTLAVALLPAGDCGEITVTVADSGSVTATGIAAAEAQLAELGARFTAFETALPGSRLDVRLQPGGTCATGLGGGWTALPGADGKVTRVSFDKTIADMAATLPTPPQLETLTFQAEKHPDLGPYFATGQTPLVWCRRNTGADADIGVCKREAYGARWEFLGNRGSYTAFPLQYASGG